MTEDCLAVFSPSGLRGRFAQGTTLLDAARRLGVDLDSVCGGRGICGRCQVTIEEGSFPKLGIDSRGDHVSAWNDVEGRYAEKRGALPERRRLGCQAALCGDVAIDVPADSQVHRQVVRKRAATHPIAVDPLIHLHYVDVAQPDMHDPASDFRRLCDALATQWGLDDIHADLAVLRGLQEVLRQGAWNVTVAVRKRRDIVAIWPGLRAQAHGLAVDIGSTTIAAHLCDLVTGDVTRDAGLVPADVLEMTVVGNPIMHHLFLGLDPTELGGAPFALTIDAGFELRAREAELDIAPGGFVYLLPCIAGHVGADTAGVVLSEGPHLRDEVTLLVDVGTNAELVLGNRSRLLACSSPTGPAFEGAQISCGQRAAPGAIERLRIDRDTLEPRFQVIGCAIWSDDPAFAGTGVTGICGSGIIEAIAEMFLAGLLTSDGVIDGAQAARTPRIVADGRTFSYVISEATPRLVITQSDVRAIQLAKGALYAGARLLLDRYGVASPDRITLAGAFGSHIDVAYAMVLGLIPDCDLAKVTAAGNAAGTGARIALLNAAARVEIEALVRRIEKIETAIEPEFQRHFIDAMAIPHKTDPFARLRAVMRLPPPPDDDAIAAGRRGRRRR